jgi:cytochrome c6
MNHKFVSMLLIAALAIPVASYADASPDSASSYKSKCAMCHGADGAGQTPTGKSMKVRDLRSADVQKMSDADLMKVIADGKGKMPAYKAKLSSEEIQALVAFIRALKH